MHSNTFIYHMTHYRNLSKILSSNGLVCVSNIMNNGQTYCNIANNEIQNRRASYSVPVEPFGTLHNYVPFYFAPKSPMLYSIYKGNVIQYTEGQEPLIYLVSSAQKIKQNGVPFCFTDGHGIMHFTEYYNDLKELHNVDWDIMKSKYWHDTIEDNDRKRRRMAEFLVYQYVPLDCIIGIAVYSQKYKEEIEKILTVHNVSLPIELRSNWYY
ncbi:hypothetical protein AT268_25760 [Bacillus cereus]|uniref:DarT domain-containing protein n=1 Tax=Bacillus cereus TaxID=1396 RepID=A0A9X0MHW7_BACCE|nr:DUF4433 domain-containing protein [Bacillus cereus]KXY47203.1 hypothetical protein AT268_25760 [Bacillus cereus]MCU5529150.1 DUF4433 domain-containing protein [Bacillus cereus]